MRYRPNQEKNKVEPEVLNKDEDEEVYFEGRPRYVSDQTAFMRWSTEPEKGDLFDKEIFDSFKYKIMAVTKFPALANIKNEKTVRLIRLQVLDAELAWDAGLKKLAISTVLDIINTYQISRGINGFFQNALITQRKEWRDRSESEKKRGLLGDILKGNDKEQTQQEAMEGIY